MKITMVLLLLAAMASGCERAPGRVISANHSVNLRVTCVDGVEYLITNNERAMSPHFKPNGKLYTCTLQP